MGRVELPEHVRGNWPGLVTLPFTSRIGLTCNWAGVKAQTGKPTRSTMSGLTFRYLRIRPHPSSSRKYITKDTRFPPSGDSSIQTLAGFPWFTRGSHRVIARAALTEQGSAILVPRFYSPDTTVNYEIGVKSEVLDHRLLLDASAYYIQWKDIQLQLIDPTNGVFFITPMEARRRVRDWSYRRRQSP